MRDAVDVGAVRRELDRRPTGDLVSILRNRDRDEWRPEVFDIVAEILDERGVPSERIAALRPEKEDVVEARHLRTLARYFNAVEAHTHRMALQEAGIKAWVLDEELGTMYGVGVGARLQVRAEDLGAARAVLDSMPAPGSVFPSDLVEVCPWCGSTDIAQRTEVPVPPDPPAEFGRRTWRSMCVECGLSWPG